MNKCALQSYGFVVSMPYLFECLVVINRLGQNSDVLIIRKSLHGRVCFGNPIFLIKYKVFRDELRICDPS